MLNSVGYTNLCSVCSYINCYAATSNPARVTCRLLSVRGDNLLNFFQHMFSKFIEYLVARFQFIFIGN